MSYFKVLGLDKEPFSTSPDPKFFYHSIGHDIALKRLEIALRLKRGLSVILGDVGTGKTTLLRTILQQFGTEDNYIFRMILDPDFKSESQFLLSLAETFGIISSGRENVDYRQVLEKYLFKKGVEEEKTIVLLIDEGQKLNNENLEILRTLLNYETNEYKLLQLVIMAQEELLPKIKGVRNFSDRIALKYTINPLDEKETAKMIEFRLRQAGYLAPEYLFMPEAIKGIYDHTQGYPRRIALLCHEALKMLIMKDKKVVDGEIVKEVISNI